MHPPGDGRFGNAEDFGGLGMGQLLPRDEGDGVAQGGFQAGDSALDPDGVKLVAAVGFLGKADEDGELLAERAEAASVPAT